MSTYIHTTDELKVLVEAFAIKLRISVNQVSLTQNDDGSLTVTIGDASFTGTLDEIWEWLSTPAVKNKFGKKI